MKPTTQSTISTGRRSLIAATVALLASAAFLSAQTSSPSTSSSRDTTKPSSSTGSSSSGSYNAGSSTYQSGTGSTDSSKSTTSPTTGAYDKSTSSSSTGAGAMTGRTSDKLSWGDRRFVNKAADSGNDEIALAKLAAEKASNSEVKSFAQKLADDHQMVANELQTIASQKNVKVDKDMDHDRTYKRLSKKTGNDFDQEFVEHMIDEHEKDIKMFEKAAQDAKDADVRSFASKHVDHLREHLRMAENLRQTLMPTGRSESSSSSATRSSTSSYDTSSSSTTPSSSSSTTTPSSSSSTTTPSSSSSTTTPSSSSSSATTPSSSSSSSDKSSTSTDRDSSSTSSTDSSSSTTPRSSSSSSR